ncbi:hypothetical protein MLD38_013153 [Melastoma candidum]|uniref:Uncharacterized protein n=1 Tax=Melastoma candidum TaxID=119954 RepID=A0ACB9RH45_9MYRT|nr:hypothetical protein MLD38_013153 [Melastoma candidum]
MTRDCLCSGRISTSGAFAAAVIDSSRKLGIFYVSCLIRRRSGFGGDDGSSYLRIGSSAKSILLGAFPISSLASSRMCSRVLSRGEHEEEDGDWSVLGKDEEELGFSSLGKTLHLGRTAVDAQGDDLSGVLKELECMGKNGGYAMEEMDEEVLSNRVLVLSRKNKVRSALELYKSMEFAGLRPHALACNSLLSCLLRNDRFDEALRVFKHMGCTENTTSHSYSLMLKAVADARGRDDALKMFVEVQRQGRAKDRFDVAVYNTVISLCGRDGDWKSCEKIWSSMKENGLSGSEVTYSMLVSIFVRCGQNELAIEAHGELVRNGHKAGADVSQAIIKAYAREENWDLAMGVFQNMLDKGLRPNIIACNALINALGRSGKDDLAFKVYNTMRSIGHVPDAYTMNALLGVLYRANRPVDALLFFDDIVREKGLPLNMHLCQSALLCCSKLGFWDRAIQLLWQMEVSGLPVSTASYNLAMNACEIARKPKIALQVYDRMIQKNCVPDTFTYLSLLRSCIWGSLWIEVDEILKAAPNASLFNAAIHGLSLRGKIDRARKIYEEMHERGFKPDGKTRALMLQNLRKR